MRITKEQRDIIHGYIISDGYVRNGSLTVENSVDQKPFVEWLYSKLEPLTTGKGLSCVQRTDLRTGVTTHSTRFFTRRVLKGFNHMWYKKVPTKKGLRNKKVLPNRLDGFFSKTFISVWYAGDGTRMIGSLGAKIEATSFSPDEKLVIQKLFKDIYDINICINKAGFSKTGTQQWTFNINANDYPKFHSIVTEIDLIPSLFPEKLCY